ncbi:MAG: SMEK domain-containing protein [Paludibacteraceae bacterium]|nr:SMEK domain-containing protein [Paludibacteraceae bacterium]
MKREEYIGYILAELTQLVYRIEVAGKLNLHNTNIYSENFFRDFFNLLYGWQLVNQNSKTHNATAIDLIDDTNKITIQVSATKTKDKVESTLTKLDKTTYKGYNVKFIFIVTDAHELRTKSYNTPQEVIFNPSSDIYDIQSIMKDINDLQTPELTAIYNFIRNELWRDLDIADIESNLIQVIKILAQADLADVSNLRVDNEFQIDEKIAYNSLSEEVKDVIKDYSIYQNNVDKVYTTFDQEGANKSFFVIDNIRTKYRAFKYKLQGNDLFNKVRELVRQEILEHPNHESLTIESINTCADILVVDTFIRCKIFDNPKGYRNVTA